ncbi:MAG: hypothetical protein EOP61_37025 [Sphingomonadales bacterium]|nr:MAG: hypothetical protein EOP61_37025 [Sphingomonadales bacterium]
MSDGVTVTLELVIKPEAADAMFAAMAAMVPDTAKRPGFRALRTVRHKDEPNRAIIIEQWDREEDYHAYMAWRTERGDMEAGKDIILSAMLNVWPTLVATA